MSFAVPGEVVETIEDVDLGDGQVADDNVPQTSGASVPQDMCRICHGGAEDSSNKLISPCLCLGSLKYVHFSCLERWTRTADKRACELCRFQYIMTVKTKPLCKEVVETIEDVDLGDGQVADDNVPQTSGASVPQDMCRICHGGAEDSSNKLISPCLCLGSLKYVHFSCLERWTRTADKRACELCRFQYIMTVKTKPLCKWELMNLSSRQKVKIIVAVTCHLIVFGVTLTALFWFLGGLRHADGSSASSHRWSFWKLVVLVVCIITWLFMLCLNGKTCFIFFKRWRSLNSVMDFQNVPESADFRVKAVAKTRAERKRGTTAGIAHDIVLQEVVSSQD